MRHCYTRWATNGEINVKHRHRLIYRKLSLAVPLFSDHGAVYLNLHTVWFRPTYHRNRTRNQWASSSKCSSHNYIVDTTVTYCSLFWQRHILGRNQICRSPHNQSYHSSSLPFLGRLVQCIPGLYGVSKMINRNLNYDAKIIIMLLYYDSIDIV